MTGGWPALLAAVLTAALPVAGLVVVGRARFLLVTVAGTSMAPTLAPGDRLLVRRSTVDSVRRGMLVVVAVTYPTVAGGPGVELMIKRAAALPGDPVPAGIPVPDRVVPAGRLIVLGDNPRQSADSRAAGYLLADDLVGVVVGRRAHRRDAGPDRPRRRTA